MSKIVTIHRQTDRQTDINVILPFFNNNIMKIKTVSVRFNQIDMMYLMGAVFVLYYKIFIS
ncbi:MAG: hypothetical protein IJV15_16160 [Lachnospiraceae bacterium]|nr:hypothetical protein [Lachnospiraceae bacterium]